jgi:hypothetical protein
MPIMGLCADVQYSGWHVVDIDFQPLGLKSDRKDIRQCTHGPHLPPYGLCEMASSR